MDSGSQIVAVTPDIFSNTDNVSVNQNSDSVHNILDTRQSMSAFNRMRSRGSAPSVSLSPASIEPAAGGGDYNESASSRLGRTAWVEGYGSYRERPRHDSSPFTRTRNGGVIVGVDFEGVESKREFGFFAGGFSGMQKAGRTTFRTLDSRGAFVGAHVSQPMGSFRLTGQFAGGFGDNDSERVVAGDIAQADYKSYFISPSVGLLMPVVFESSKYGFALIPSTQLRYTAQYLGSYDERGSSADQNVESRVYQNVSLRGLLEARFRSLRIGRGSLTPVVFMGLEGQRNIGDQDIGLSVFGQSVNLDASNDGLTSDAIFGAGLNYGLGNGINLSLDAEGYAGLNHGGVDDNVGGSVRARARYNF